MAPPAIRVEHLGKRYRLGTTHGATSRLSERVQHALGAPFRSLRPHRAPSHLRTSDPHGGELWALRDVSLEIEGGEIVGLIGRNGAGKSTLFKLLSEISPPTEGRITLWGRTATLLEVGTGFHPELTGRENIFVNGAILGMRRREIERHFDEIVEFSGIERFIDTPVKRYSSGMYVRLAFAVAAHLDPEILLVDEVLAVGDAEFQRRCLSKMHEASELGRTVVFVSHNMQTVQRLCSRAYVIEKGGIIAEGSPGHAVTEYLRRTGPVQSGGAVEIPDEAERHGTQEARLRRVRMIDREGHEISSLRIGQPFRVAVQIEASEQIHDAVFEVGLATADGERVATLQSIDSGPPLTLAEGLGEIEVDVAMMLLPGEYTLDVAVHHETGITIDYVAAAFRLIALNVPAAAEAPWPWDEPVRGYVRPDATWSEPMPLPSPRAESATAQLVTRQTAD
jgi:homopolymeric O-antigen transport system ATP-binding protein